MDLPRTMACGSAPRPLKICVVYSRLPFPMTRGDQLTVAHLLSFLRARGHFVDFYTLASGGALTPAQASWLKESCRSCRLIDHGPAQILRGLVAAAVKGDPFQVGYFRNAVLDREVGTSVQHGDYDVVYNYYLRTAESIPRIFSPNRPSSVSGRTVVAFLALQLSQTLNTRRIFENERDWLKRLFYRVEYQRLRKYEARIWRRFSKTVLIGLRDVEDLRDACRHSGEPEIDNWTLSAHGTDVDAFRQAREDEIVPGRVVFSGSMRYQPNVQAAHWFVDQCWDAVRNRVPGAELYVVGQSPVASLKELDGKRGIHVTGTVPDIGEYIRTASVCINPMLAAGGMQNKLIEYMASGKAVVATSIANEGIGAPAGSVAIADGAKEFASRTIQLLDSPADRMTLGRAAREYVVREWTWESQFEKLESAFYDALSGGR